MAKAKLSWFNEGKPFDLEVYLEDVEEYEKAEADAMADVGHGSSIIIRARHAFLLKVVERAAAKLGIPKVEARLTVAQIWGDFIATYRASTGVEDSDPLA